MKKENAKILVPSEAICGGLAYLRSLDETETNASLLPYVRIIQSAWRDFGLTGVLCVDNIPTVYIREVDIPLSDAELNELHRRFWNQGVAETLLVADPKTVRIFSGLARPQKPEAPLTKESPSLVATLTRIEFTQRAISFCQATANGAWYMQHADNYRSDSSVDAYLLDNLVGLHNDLALTSDKTLRLQTEVANALIGRILFVCYLVDRGIVVLPAPFAGKKLHETLKGLRNDNEAIAFLYALFERLKGDFNGSMFDQDLAKERQQIKSFHMQQIRQFLDGQKVGSPQHNLGFWAYDFKLIPVETISAIYEEFLAHEDPEGKRETGAFYTPRFLAEMTIDVALEGRDDWHALRYLDPCCGSGIFLVTLFNRIATKWFLDHPRCDDYLAKAEALKSILSRNIRGIDLNPTACRLACFSLYIAFLDCLSPADIDTYVIETKHKLPYLLAGTSAAGDTECIPVIRRADILEENSMPEEPFDCLIGNPPWQGRSSKLLATRIVEHAERHIAVNGKGCLLLPSKMFLNTQTNSFQAQWLKRVAVERVIQLADYSFVLFEQALCPAMIVRYRKEEHIDPGHRIAYETPKFHPTTRRRGLITIGSQDHKWLSQAKIREAARNGAAPAIWKRWLWGTERDQRLLTYMETFPLLADIAGEPQEGKRWVKGQGFQPNTSGNSPDPKSPWWQHDDLFIPARSACLKASSVLLERDCEQISDRFQTLHRPRDPRLYKAPLILVSQGFSKVVFSSFDVLFQDSLQSIAGPPEDEDLLLFLTAYLRSNLAKYVMFHTAANWGTERDKVQLEELLTLPFPLTEDAPAANAADIVREIADRMRQEKQEQEELYRQCLEQHRNLTGTDEEAARKEWIKRRKERTDLLQTELEPLIYAYFGLHEPEVMLLKDTVHISIPSSTPSEARAETMDLPTLQLVSAGKVQGYQQGIVAYADTLTGTLNNWAEERGSDFRVKAAGGVDETAGVAMISLSLGKEIDPMVQLTFKESLSQWLRRGLDACARQSATIRSEREMLWFEEEQVHIIRPATLNHWTRTAALNDADTIYGEIAMARRRVDA